MKNLVLAVCILIVAKLAAGEVKCDDANGCPAGNTCCKMNSADWNCCPLPQATCCKDGAHCCPRGYQCQSSTQTCTKPGGITLAWFEKHPVMGHQQKDDNLVRKPENVQAVKCDATHECLTGQTCCKLPSGDWGCCPLPQATCCSDHLHCCPHGKKCDLAQGTCVSGLTSIPWLEKTPALLRKPENVQAVKCDATHECLTGQTCCKLPSGDWGCCPLPQATCCSDHLHCCPHGKKCDLAQGTCVSGLTSIPWLEKTPALLRKPENVQAVKCDATHECLTGQTCCKLPSGDWGCCPLPQATCCSDHLHCCPHGKKCDLAQGTCVSGLTSIPWLEKTPALLRKPENVQAVKCDATHECLTGQTCCKLPSGDWGCCPLPQATCCSDHLHCCPHGKKCDLAQGTCVSGLTSIPWLEKTPALLRKPENVQAVKCDATHECLTGQTCCKLPSGDWGCCPLPQATCCSDHLHCCPHGKKCDLAQGTCVSGLTSIPWLEKTPALLRKPENVEAVKCDATHECLTGQTCCKLPSGDWGCCPLPQATCCSDHLHCCPHGKKCDLAQGTCVSGLTSIPWLEKTPALLRKPENVEAVKCDATHECLTGQTCCKLPSGDWGCCPLPQATCCSDHLHCCPHGKKCDLAQGTCVSGLTSIPWLEKTPALLRKPENVEAVKCDATHECLTGQTCCKLPSGDWGCCPLPQATCCSDHLHCCPHGKKCDLAQGTCVSGLTSIPWLEKTPALLRKPENVEAVKCDATHECLTGQTCCKLPSGDWGCCPLPQATCCSDHLHCCPHGKKCDLAQGTCVSGLTSIPWLEKTPALLRKPENVEAVKCDATHECLTGQTCCKLPSGDWGCCPLPQATCCSDHLHCCPHGKKCDLAQGTCVSGLTSIPWLEKTPALLRKPENVEAVKCDATHECLTGQTCCKLPSGDWGCCPLPQATCCSDHLHCCPHGKKCDLAQGTCVSGLTSIPWLEKTPALLRKPENVEAVKCDATHECLTGQTCCKLPSGDWGCCPLPQATCCSDHLHCCPHGKKCDLAQGTCVSGLTSIPWLEKTPALLRKPENVEAVKCDATHECLTGQTCCKLPSGDWGCCPLPQATCCSDHLHCCPHGKKCDLAQGTCVSGLTSIPWLEKTPALLRKPENVEAVKCDATHECLTGQTCCKLPSGDWGCCPLPQATCCSDHLHCCPHGKKCDLAQGTCVSGLTSIPWLERTPALLRP